MNNMSSMFYGCTGLIVIDLSGWDTSKVADMIKMFGGCSGLTTIYVSNAWSTAQVERSYSMFASCDKLVGGAGTVFNSSYTDKTYAKIDGGLGDPGYFSSLITLEYDNDILLAGEVGKPVVTIKNNNFTVVGYEVVSGGKYVQLDDLTGEVTSVFEGRAIIEITAVNSAGITITAQATIMSAPSVTAVYSKGDRSLSFYKTAERVNVGDVYSGKIVTNVYYISQNAVFADCYDVPWSDVRENVANVTIVDEINPVGTAYWFYGMSACTSMDLAKLDTSSVTDMSYMFYGCTSLNSLDLFYWDTSSVTNMTSMFRKCNNLTTIYVSDFWSVTGVTSSSDMFASCVSLVGNAGTTFSSSNLTKGYARVDGGHGDPGYLSSPIALSYGNGLLPLGATMNPVVTIKKDNFTVIGYEVISGAECVQFDVSTGAVTGIADGQVVIEVTAVNPEGVKAIARTTINVAELITIVYSESDGSLSFYKATEGVNVGDVYSGKIVTNVYHIAQNTVFTDFKVGHFYS